METRRVDPGIIRRGHRIGGGRPVFLRENPGTLTRTCPRRAAGPRGEPFVPEPLQIQGRWRLAFATFTLGAILFALFFGLVAGCDRL
jgi:hypothetical protein